MVYAAADIFWLQENTTINITTWQTFPKQEVEDFDEADDKGIYILQVFPRVPLNASLRVLSSYQKIIHTEVFGGTPGDT